MSDTLIYYVIELRWVFFFNNRFQCSIFIMSESDPLTKHIEIPSSLLIKKKRKDDVIASDYRLYKNWIYIIQQFLLINWHIKYSWSIFNTGNPTIILFNDEHSLHVRSEIIIQDEEVILDGCHAQMISGDECNIIS